MTHDSGTGPRGLGVVADPVPADHRGAGIGLQPSQDGHYTRNLTEFAAEPNYVIVHNMSFRGLQATWSIANREAMSGRSLLAISSGCLSGRL
jgi:hypothetical protein